MDRNQISKKIVETQAVINDLEIVVKDQNVKPHMRKQARDELIGFRSELKIYIDLLNEEL